MTRPTLEREIILDGKEEKEVGWNGFTEMFSATITLYLWSDGRTSWTRYPEWAPCAHLNQDNQYCTDCYRHVDEDES